MPSTFTTNLGIQKPADGEQDGVWGDVVNDNMDIIDRASNGQLTLMLTGTSSTLTTSNGIPSNGQYKMLVLSGTPSGTHTITILPNDAQKIYFVQNNTAQSVIFTQGSGGNTTILPSDSAIIYCDGAVLTARVQNLTDTLGMSSPNITGGTITGATISGIPDLDVAGGSVGAPAYSFTGDTDTGMYRSAENTLNFSLGGVQAMRLAEGFAIFPAATTEQKTIELGSGRTGNGFALIDLIGDATYTDYGTRLVRGSGGPNTTSILSHRGTGPLILEAVDAASITMETTNIERMRVTAAGLVGIGTTTPAASLHVVGGILARAGAPGAVGVNNNGFSFGGDGDTGMFSGGDGIVDFYSQSAAVAQISAAGNVGIGTAGASSRLRVYRENPSTYSNSHIEMLSAAGDVVLGFHAIAASAVNIVHPRGSGERLAFVNGLRTAYIPIDASAFVVSSDYRIKENIAPLDNAITRLSALQPKRFNFLESSMMYRDGITVDGFIAHEVQAVVPEAVTGEKDAVNAEGAPIYQGIDQAKLVPLLTAALQEALAKITALEARVAALET